MARIVLVTGGSRSGKSRYAQQQAERLPGPRGFVATCAAQDEEMRQRIARHQREREGMGWHTIEEPLRVPEALQRHAGMNVLLVDCVTFWVSNVMLDAERSGETLEESVITGHATELVQAAERCAGTVFLVTNEVGMGVVPATELGRRFRDLAGRCNQALAAAADVVTLMVAGLPVPVKGRPEHDAD